MSDIPISGYAAPGFEPVREVFTANFRSGEDLGAGFCAIQNGKVLIDLHGGFTSRKKDQLWSADTLVPVYSTTKPISALVLARVIDQAPDGYETPVAEIWPEFGAAGKDQVTIGDMVSHQAGLPGFIDPVDPAIWLNPPACAAALAALPPLWPPGTAHGYHPTSWGYLIGETVARLSGRSLGTILQQDICAPHGIEFWIGTPDREAGRIAEMQRPRALPDLGELNVPTKAAFLTKWASAPRGAAAWRKIEIPSANGHGSARSVAELYSIYAHHGRYGEAQLIPEENFRALAQSRTEGQDLVLPFMTEFAAGVMLNNIGIYGPHPGTFGHSGWGGSLALGDPDLGLSAAYVMNRQSNTLQGDPRARRLVDALYECL